MNRPQKTPEEDELYELLVFLVEKFETEFYHPGKSAAPFSMLTLLLEQKNSSKTDISALFQDELDWDGLSNNTVIITPSQAKVLGNFFGIDKSLFIKSL